MVYELFDLPIGHPLNRDETVKLYTERSRIELTMPAIAPSGSDPVSASTPRSSTGLRAITAGYASPPPSNARVTARSDLRMKQDITAEKVSTRSAISRTRPVDQPAEPGSVPIHLRHALRERGGPGQTVALFLIDLDGFKQVNDRPGSPGR